MISLTCRSGSVRPPYRCLHSAVQKAVRAVEGSCNATTSVIKSFCYCPDTGDRKGVHAMEILSSFIISVLASVAAYYLCKWLDGDE